MKRANFPLSRPQFIRRAAQNLRLRMSCEERGETTFCAIKKERKKIRENFDQTRSGIIVAKLALTDKFLFEALAVRILLSEGRVPRRGEGIKRIENNIRPSGKKKS